MSHALPSSPPIRDKATCEWPNGNHTIFAIARSQSAIEGFSYNYPITYGSAVSPYVAVTFSNLISRLDFSQPYFEPALGQTQQVTAAFAANCNWTLQIQDANSNTIRTVTGSGNSMVFNWDGTGDNETSIPDGVYTYLLSAETNGEADEIVTNGSGGGGGSPPMPDLAFSNTSELWAMSVDGNDAVPLAIYPPGFGTTGLTIVSASPSEINAARATSSNARLSSTSDGFSPMDSGGSYSGAASQFARAPKRKPKIGVKNKSGTFGVCYYTYPYGGYSQQPPTGRIYPLQPLFTGVDGGAPSSSYFGWSALKTFKAVADGFAGIMKIGSAKGSYKPAFIKGDGDWGAQDIKKSSLGGKSVFNTCNFGLLLTHGCYGTQPEIDGIKYTYLFLYDEKYGSSYVRLSDMDFGSSGVNGLRWMTILSCNMLFPDNVTSMANHSLLPDNENLHLLLGATTVTYSTPTLGAYYATNLLADTSIWQSFQNAGQVAYQEAYVMPKLKPMMTNTVTFRVMGYQSCINDKLFEYSDPDPNTTYRIIDSTVFIPSP